MGCGASRTVNSQFAGNPEFIHVTSAWDRAWTSMGVKKGTKIKSKGIIVKRSGWRTIRIFVSSTFRDFHQEREILVKKVFPDLRLWCEAQRLRLIECDLRWGVPKDDNTEGTLRACLGEIDRCYSDNIMPFFINMTSERVGWVPTKDEVPESISSEYKWIDGLSVTEMEIMHAAYKIDNPNAIFMLRDPKFIDLVPEEYRDRFVESTSVAPMKLDILRNMIKERFPSNLIHRYQVEYLGYNPDTKMVELGGLDNFAEMVFTFFKERIAAQYPAPDDSNQSPYQHAREQHESFMSNRSEYVFGRDATLNEIENYICQSKTDVPLILIGNAGSGKSSITARVAEQTSKKALAGQIQISSKKKDVVVFYHFVGAVPGSTDLGTALKRLLLELGVCKENTLPKDMESTAQLVRGALSNPNTKPTVVIIDALNQFDTDVAAETVTWVPRKLAPQIRCIFSMIQDTPQHKALMKREPQAMAIEVSPLDSETKTIIVTEMLGRYNKRLDEEQMNNLLNKSSSSNPLWLSIAVEELRVFGMFRKILDKINQLADGLLELEIQIIERFENETNRNLLTATLCLMECSGHGLLETELLAMLADEDNLMMDDPEEKDSGTEKGEKGQPEKSKGGKKFEFLPAHKWSDVYRNLKPFLRPFGDSGEGRLDFYHRSLSKAVRRKYFYDQEGNTREDVYTWWHNKLAEYFEKTTDKKRQVEEYPVHLEALGDTEKLEAYLSDWDVFMMMFDEDYSSRLINLWRKGPGFDKMEDVYMKVLDKFQSQKKVKAEAVNECKTYIAKFFIQAGRLAAADKLLQEIVHKERDELGNRDAYMVELYQIMASNKDEMQKMEGYYNEDQLEIINEIISNFDSSIKLRRQFSGEKNQRKMAACLNRLGFYYAEKVEIIGLGEDSEERHQVKDLALECVEEAINIYKELGDEAMVADCMITKGVAYGRGAPGQLKMYKESEKILMGSVGEYHNSVTRVCQNIGVFYEEQGLTSEAADYFYKTYLIFMELYGEEHTRTCRSIETLNEPQYKSIYEERGMFVPEIPLNDDDY